MSNSYPKAFLFRSGLFCKQGEFQDMTKKIRVDSAIFEHTYAVAKA